MRLTQEEIASIALFELQQAQGYDSDTLETKRATALKYYHGQLPAPPAAVDANGNPVAVRSGAVSMDVADCLHSLLAQITPILKTSAVEFEPDSQDDEKQAQAESDLVRRMIERNGGFEAISGASFDALLISNGWIAIDIDEVTEETEQHFPPELSPEQIAILQQPASDKEERTVTIDDTETVLTVKQTSKKLSFRAVAPENILFSNSTGLDGGLHNLRFVAERRYFTASQLLDMDIKQALIDEIPDATPSDDTGNAARAGAYANDQNGQPAQDAEALKEVFVSYLRLDIDGKGTTRRFELWLAGNNCLYMEPDADLPFITGSAVPLPHRIEGTGLYELLAQVQNTKSHILRQYLDNLSVANLGRVGAIEGEVNMSDLTNGRHNGVVRMRRADAVFPFPFSDIGPQALAGLNYMDNVRTQRVGSALDFNEAQAQIMGSSATAAAGQLAKVEQMAGWFANNLVETLLKPAMMKVHDLLRREFTGTIGGKLRGAWVEMDPRQWPARKNMVVNLGLTSGERAARIGALTQLITQQGLLIGQGADGVLVGFSQFYNSMSDWIRANNLNSPDEYLIDPESPEAKQAAAGKAQSAQQQQQHMEQLQQQMIAMQQQFELQKQQNDLQYKVWHDQLQADIKEAELTTSAISDARKTQADNMTKIITKKESPDNGPDNQERD